MALGVGVCCSLGGVAAHGGAEHPSMCHVTMASCDTGIINTRPVWSVGACLWTLTELWAAIQPCDPVVGRAVRRCSLHGTTPHWVSVGGCGS